MTAIFRRELRSYFSSMIGYVFVAAAVAVIGFYFMIRNMMAGYPGFGGTVSSLTSFLMILIPLLTMKSMSEERKNKTDQLLFTSPVSITDIVVGKYLSMLLVYAVPLLISCLCPVIIAIYGATSQLLGDYCTIFAVFCFGAMLISIGLFISSQTENQIIAAIVTFIVILLLDLWETFISILPTSAGASFAGCLVLWLVVAMIYFLFSRDISLTLIVAAVGGFILTAIYLVKASLYENILVKLMSALSILGPVDNFANYNVFDVKGIVMYLSISALFVFLTVQGVQKRRWS